MQEEKRGPGRPATVVEEQTLRLNQEGKRAQEWLMKRSGLGKNAQTMEALIRYARELGWRPKP